MLNMFFSALVVSLLQHLEVTALFIETELQTRKAKLRDSNTLPGAVVQALFLGGRECSVKQGPLIFPSNCPATVPCRSGNEVL
jgi:hypothetical protein